MGSGEWHCFVGIPVTAAGLHSLVTAASTGKTSGGNLADLLLLLPPPPLISGEEDVPVVLHGVIRAAGETVSDEIPVMCAVESYELFELGVFIGFPVSSRDEP
nr:hypothetical protein Iba_scaffold37823CG0010 [Ipomoea batatas]GMD49751.1 hypothetical protein Iba_scaffold1361513CG0010 [Ipomoea batatas]